MADSEKSYADRLQRARDLQAATATFSPVYTPVDLNLSPSSFMALITTVGNLNTALDGPQTALSDAVQARVTDAKTAKSLTTQIVAYVKSNAAWKAKFARIKTLADKVRGFKPPRATPPPGPTPPKKPRDRGDGSYAEIAANFAALVTALNALGSYNPPDNAIKLTALTPLSTRLGTNNSTVATAEQEVSEAQRNRYTGYFGTGGLKERFAAVKQAVKGQYGQNSPQWAQVSGIGWG